MAVEARSNLASRLEALEQRVDRARAFSRLRRQLRETEGPAQIASAVAQFAHDVLSCTSFAVYLGAKAEPVLELLAAAPEGLCEEPALPRDGGLVASLDGGTAMIPVAELRGQVLAEGAEAFALALRGDPGELIGVVLAAGTALDLELVGELVFDLESALSARMVARLRAEELAVLEIQERELVGLLRDVEARDAIIQRDLQEARTFQHHMLGAPPQVGGASIEVVYQPLGLVGGDLYAVSTEGDRLRVFVADATGHGVRASLTTMFIKSSYEAVRAAAADPAAVLSRLNDALAGAYGSREMLFTAACVDIDLVTGRCLCASGGHPEICVVIGGQASFIDGVGPLLGVKPGLAFTNREIVLGRGDGVYLYSDGFIEPRRGSELFGTERFLQVVADAHVAGRPVGNALVTAVRSFLAEAPLGDDGTFVGVRLDG
jgi:sigma-B regulation protein RsbU (phosphoserine phosphatase)